MENRKRGKRSSENSLERLMKITLMVLRESMTRAVLERRPEPTHWMDDVDQATAFHEEGASTLIPIYHFNALAVSRWVPVGGTVVDLGSGSGQFLAYLAARRPDLRIVGLELAPSMVSMGQEFLRQRGVSSRVELRLGDMTSFSHDIDFHVDCVSSVFSLHHLPAMDDLLCCLEQIRDIRARTGCAVWVFDFARPRHPETPKEFPRLFTPHSHPIFNRDSTNSLIASYAFDEIKSRFHDAGLDAHHWLSRWMRLYQIHEVPVSPPTGVTGVSGVSAAWQDVPSLSDDARRDWRALQFLFPNSPV